MRLYKMRINKVKFINFIRISEIYNLQSFINILLLEILHKIMDDDCFVKIEPEISDYLPLISRFFDLSTILRNHSWLCGAVPVSTPASTSLVTSMINTMNRIFFSVITLIFSVELTAALCFRSCVLLPQGNLSATKVLTVQPLYEVCWPIETYSHIAHWRLCFTSQASMLHHLSPLM